MDYFSFFEKNIGVLSLEEQNKLKNSKVAIIGLGGIGGIALEVLARTGIENFVICDKDKFEPSNFNRQILATLDFIGKSKVQAGLKRLKKINKNVKVKVFGKMEKKNVMKIIDGVDVVVDGLDNLRDRIILARACRKKKIPYVFGSAARDIGMSTIFMPNEKFEEVFRITKNKEKMLTCDFVIGFVPNLVGIFEAIQTVNLIIGRKVIKAPDVAFFSPFGKFFYVRKFR